MQILIQIFIILVILIHIYIVWLEMFAWTTRGRKVFKQFKPELFEPTKTLAANQGLYNGFLAAGLIWTFFISNPEWKINISLFFLGCVAVAGIYGAVTASKKIFIIQAVPALIPILLILIQKYIE
jgi:putative membrane protein